MIILPLLCDIDQVYFTKLLQKPNCFALFLRALRFDYCLLSLIEEVRSGKAEMCGIIGWFSFFNDKVKCMDSNYQSSDVVDMWTVIKT